MFINQQPCAMLYAIQSFFETTDLIFGLKVNVLSFFGQFEPEIFLSCSSLLLQLPIVLNAKIQTTI